MTGFAQDLTKSMAPKIMWVNAILWDQLETARLVKKRADALMLEKDYLAAGDRYEILYEMYKVRETLIDDY
jgi:hypothetical protein